MLRVEHGNRLEILARELADRLRADPSPPLVPEIVAVPNRGMARWLSFEFADRLGLCASID
ncbi:MAG: exodeoxyribonuclease V subunit gamma, partial [Alphaproteobacteria bacterium]